MDTQTKPASNLEVLNERLEGLTPTQSHDALNYMIGALSSYVSGPTWRQILERAIEVTR